MMPRKLIISATQANAADAQCGEDGQLVVGDLRTASFPERMLGNSMHVYDYSLFHLSIRKNAIDRVMAFLKNRKSSTFTDPTE